MPDATISLGQTQAHAQEIFRRWLRVWQRANELNDPEMSTATKDMCVGLTQTLGALAEAHRVSQSDIVPLAGSKPPES